MNTYTKKLKTFSIKCAEATSEPYRCTSPRQAAPVLRRIFEDLELDESQEHFVVVTLNAKGVVEGFKHLASGTETGVLVSPAMIFRAALILGGTSVIMCHNHPSGSTEPSREDTLLTKRCKSAAEVIGVALADHIILGKDEQHSFRASEGWDN